MVSSGREHFFLGEKLTTDGQFVANAVLHVLFYCVTMHTDLWTRILLKDGQFVDSISKPAGRNLDSTEYETIYQPVLYIMSYFLANGWPTLHNLQSVTCLRNADPLSTLRQQFHLCKHHSSFILVNELLSSNHSSVWSAITTHKNQFFRRTRRISNLAVFILGDSNTFPVFFLQN